jgi:hypothetical protein
MTSLYLGLNRGALDAQQGVITVGSSTNSTDMEFRWDNTKSLTRKDLVMTLRAIEQYIKDNAVGGSAGVGTGIPPL